MAGRPANISIGLVIDFQTEALRKQDHVASTTIRYQSAPLGLVGRLSIRRLMFVASNTSYFLGIVLEFKSSACDPFFN